MPEQVITAKFGFLPSSAGKIAALAFVFLWFMGGGLGHFFAADFFAAIMPSYLPWHYPAVYISGVFEIAGAIGLLLPHYRRWAGNGLFVLTLVVSPVNIHMWLHPADYPDMSETMLGVRLLIQIVLLACIYWSTRGESSPRDQ